MGSIWNVDKSCVIGALVLLFDYYLVPKVFVLRLRRMLQLTGERITLLFNRCNRSKFRTGNRRGLMNMRCSKQNLGFVHAYLNLVEWSSNGLRKETCTIV